MKRKKIFNNPFADLSRFEWGLWITSLALVLSSFFVGGSDGIANLVASLIGVTALIFQAKGYVIAQVLMIIFAVMYGVISFFFGYYGEMITYVGMSLPMAVVSLISWMRNLAKDRPEVKVRQKLKISQIIVMLVFALIVTLIFYFILAALNTKNLFFSTISVTTSFVAAYLTFLRSPYYALAYSMNDIILIVLWIGATVEDRSYLSMIVCFVVFLFNDLYGFFNWQRMKERQKSLEIIK